MGRHATFVWGHLSEQLGLLTRAVFLGPVFVTWIVFGRQLVDLGERRHWAGICFLPSSRTSLQGVSLPSFICPRPWAPLSCVGSTLPCSLASYWSPLGTITTPTVSVPPWTGGPRMSSPKWPQTEQPGDAQAWAEIAKACVCERAVVSNSLRPHGL